MAANSLYGVTDLSCDCRGCETTTLAVDRLQGNSFVMPEVPCDCLKVGLDFVWTDLQATIRDREKWTPPRPMKSCELSNGENRIALRQLLQNRKLRHL